MGTSVCKGRTSVCFFVDKSTDGQTINLCLDDELMVYELREIEWASVFCLSFSNNARIPQYFNCIPHVPMSLCLHISMQMGKTATVVCLLKRNFCFPCSANDKR
jgi:hypothetical protein